jgi:hypothetical protein
LSPEPVRHLAHQRSAQSLSLQAPQDVDLVEFAYITRHTAVVARAACETNELMRVVFDDDEREVRRGIRAENLLPLMLANDHPRSVTVRLTERLDVEDGQRYNVTRRCVPQVKGHWHLDEPCETAA